jgi:molecular chaperone IbpA
MDMTSFDFSPLFRSSVGFDRLGCLMESVLSPHGESTYPPYDIEKTGQTTYRITVAVAGFGEDDLDVSVRENTLSISGKIKRDEKEGERKFLYHGIAGRAFRLAFALADAVEVVGASLDNGLLHVDLERAVPEEAKPRRVDIRSGAPRKAIAGKAA